MRTPLLVALLVSAVACSADVTPNQPFVYVTGTAHLSAKADIGSFRFVLVERHEDVSVAVDRMKAKVAKVFELIAAEQISEKDVTAHKERIEQQVDREKSQNVIGVKVTRDFSIRVRNVTHLSDIYDKLLKLGVAELTGAFFDYSKKPELLAKCETLALEDARKHAETIAKNIGSRIERVYAVSTRPMADLEDQFLPGARSVYESDFVQPIQPPPPPKGDLVIPEIVVEQSVNVIFTLAQ